MPKVSVIIPIYNGEKYLKNCVDSVLTQTMQDFELILINDGSIDTTSIICDELATYDSRIKVIHQENSGVSTARNRGIDASKGEYICFIDCDDFIDSHYLNCLYHTCNINNVKMSICSVSAINEDYSLISKREVNQGLYNFEEALKELFSFTTINSGPCGKLIHKSLLEQGIRFPLLATYEDLLFSYKCIYSAKEIYFTQETTYNYVHRKGIGAMDKFIKNPTTDVIVAAYEALSFIKQTIPSIWDTAFYGMISQVIMYINDINQIDSNWESNNTNLYIKETKKLLKKYRKELLNNKSIFTKEKISFFILSYSTTLYKYLIVKRNKGEKDNG